MYIKSKIFSASVKILVAAVCVIGLVWGTHFYVPHFDISFLFSYSFVYGLLVLIYFINAAIYHIRNRKSKHSHSAFLPFYNGLCIVSTSFCAFCAGHMFSGSFFISDDVAVLVIMQIVLPTLAAFDWLLFARKGKIKVYYPLIWTAIFLVITILFVMLRQSDLVGGQMRYEFLDINAVGVSSVFGAVGLLTAISLIFGYIFYFFDHAMDLLQKRKALKVKTK